MYIVCEKNLLASALGLVQRAVAAKSPLPSLKGVLFTGKDSNLILSATDLEFGLVCTIQTEVIEPGSIVFPAKMLTEFIRRLPDGDVSFESKPESPLSFTISSGSVKLDITGYAPEEFPRLPGAAEEEYNQFSISKGLFKEMLIQTEVAIAREETRPILTGLFMETASNKIKLVATDGHRLAYRQARVDSELELKMVIPGKAVQELIRILDDDGGNVNIHLGKSDVSFHVGAVILSSRLLEGKYPPYQQIIPSDFNATVVCDVKQMLASLERAEVVAREGANNLVKITLTSEGLNVSTSSPDVGAMEDIVSAEINGEQIAIRFNVRLLLDSLRNIKSQQVSLDFTGEFSPCLIRPVNDHNLIHLVLPIRLS